MSDLVSLEGGSPPWQPSSSATLAKTFNFYDRPLLGVIQQHGMDFLFQCWAGEIESWHIWVYSRLEMAERASLETATDRDAFMSLVDRALSGRRLTVAIARDGVGIVASTIVDFPDEIPSASADLAKGQVALYGEEPDLLRLARHSPYDSSEQMRSDALRHSAAGVSSTVSTLHEFDPVVGVARRELGGEAAK